MTAPQYRLHYHLHCRTPPRQHCRLWTPLPWTPSQLCARPTRLPREGQHASGMQLRWWRCRTRQTATGAPRASRPHETGQQHVRRSSPRPCAMAQSQARRRWAPRRRGADSHRSRLRLHSRRLLGRCLHRPRRPSRRPRARPPPRPSQTCRIARGARRARRGGQTVTRVWAAPRRSGGAGSHRPRHDRRSEGGHSRRRIIPPAPACDGGWRRRDEPCHGLRRRRPGRVLRRGRR
eukprot:scaffold15670_cov112-Isochrysis_galbana.AAC.14